MPKLIVSELQDANDYANSIEINGLNDLYSYLLSFITNSGNELSGCGYDAVRNKLNLYSDALMKQDKLFKILNNQIIAANNCFNNYSEGYSEIDDSKLDEIESSLSKIQSCYDWLLNIDSDEYESLFQSNNKSYDEYLNSVYMDLQNLKKYYQKIKNLIPTDRECYSMISRIENDLHGFNIAVSKINPTEFCNNNYDKIDFSRMNSESRTRLERIMLSWPNDMEIERCKMIEEAFVLSERNICYSMKYRRSVDKDGRPVFMDCSSFASHLCNYAGLKDNRDDESEYVPFNLDWTTYYFVKRSNEVDGEYPNEFKRIDESELIPGDFALIYAYNNGVDVNHIVMYIGNDIDGKPLMVDCSSINGEYGNAINIRPLNSFNYECYIRYQYGYGNEQTNNEDVIDEE